MIEQVFTSHFFSQGELLKAKLPPVLDSLKQPHGVYCNTFQARTRNYLNYLKQNGNEIKRQKSSNGIESSWSLPVLRVAFFPKYYSVASSCNFSRSSGSNRALIRKIGFKMSLNQEEGTTSYIIAVTISIQLI